MEANQEEAPRLVFLFSSAIDILVSLVLLAGSAYRFFTFICRDQATGKSKATQSFLQTTVTRRRKTSTAKHSAGPAAEITMPTSFGLAAIYVRGGTMGNA